MIAAEGSEDAAKYKKYVAQEEELKTMYADRPEEPEEERELEDLPTYSTSLGALLTFGNAKALLASFCGLLTRSDQFTPPQKPVYRFLEHASPFTYEVTLPKLAALSQSTFVSDAWPTKKAAEQQTAFDCCIALHQSGAIDDHLLPVRDTLTNGAKDAVGREVDRSKLPTRATVSNPNPFGNVWTSERAFFHVVELRSRETTYRLGLLCASRQLSLDDGAMIYNVSGNTARVRTVEVEEVQWKSNDERDDVLGRLERFNRLCTMVQLNRLLGDDDRFFALWVPLSDAGRLDPRIVDQAFLEIDEAKMAPDALIVVPFRNIHSRIGRLVRVRDDVTTASTTAAIVTDPVEAKCKSKVIARMSVPAPAHLPRLALNSWIFPARITRNISASCTLTTASKKGAQKRSWNSRASDSRLGSSDPTWSKSISSRMKFGPSLCRCVGSRTSRSTFGTLSPWFRLSIDSSARERSHSSLSNVSSYLLFTLTSSQKP